MLAACLAALGAFACGDVFHGTEYETACTRDKNACRLHDYCALTPTEAQERAIRTCARLGSCAGPLGDNAFGACVANAILAYDCGARPGQSPRAEARAYWDCLYAATDAPLANACGMVEQCLIPPNTPQCSTLQDSVGCAYPSGQIGTRIACSDGGRVAIQRCLDAPCVTASQIYAACTISTSPCTHGCAPTNDSVFVTCEPDGGPIRQLTDCHGIGDGRCTPYGCAPAYESDAGVSCTNSEVICRGDTAVACANGYEDTVDCARLGAKCVAHPLDDARASCVGTMDKCPVDFCQGATLFSCANGVVRSVDCTSVGYAKCELALIPGERAARARCVL